MPSAGGERQVGKWKWTQEKQGELGFTCEDSVQLPNEFDFQILGLCY